MNKYIYLVLTVSIVVFSCESGIIDYSNEIENHFEEYCKITSGNPVPPEESDHVSYGVCMCGTEKCIDTVCNKDKTGCLISDCINGEELCKDNKVFECISGMMKEKDDCGENGQCYNGKCYKSKIYKEIDGVCKTHKHVNGEYKLADKNECSNNVSCKNDKDNNLICGDCNNNSGVICRIDDSGKAYLEQCSYGHSIKTPCGNLHFCYNNECAECDVQNKDTIYREVADRCIAYECIDGFLEEIKGKCKDGVSCKKDKNGNLTCGECYNNSGFECKEGTSGGKASEEYCNNGITVHNECVSPNCDVDGKQCNECSDSDKIICTNNEEGGVLRKCQDKTVIPTQCKKNKESVSCNEARDNCGECLNDKVRCDNDKLQICKNGDWINKEEDENGCFTHNDKTYYCENSTTYKECTSLCYKNQCLNENQGVIVTEKAFVRRTPVITKVDQNSESKLDNYIVGYLNKDTIVDVVGKTDNDVYLLRFENHNDIKDYKKYGSWEDGKEYYYVKNDDIKTRNENTLESSETKSEANIYFSKIPQGDENFDKQFFEVNYDDIGNELNNVYDDVLKKTRKQAFKEAFDADPEPVENLENLTSIKKMYPDIASNWTIDQYYIYDGKWKKNKSDVPDMTEELRTFFTDNNNNKSRIVIARVGSESSNESSGMWNYLHYITIYGYDSGFKYNDKKGLFYIKDTIWGDEQKHCVGVKCAEYKSFPYKPFYATHENIPSQATQFYFFEKK